MMRLQHGRLGTRQIGWAAAGCSTHPDLDLLRAIVIHAVVGCSTHLDLDLLQATVKALCASDLGQRPRHVRDSGEGSASAGQRGIGEGRGGLGVQGQGCRGGGAVSAPAEQ